jgi:hypothetical protein
LREPCVGAGEVQPRGTNRNKQTSRTRTLTSPQPFLSESPSNSHPATNHGSGLFGRLEICSMFRRQGRGRGHHRRWGCPRYLLLLCRLLHRYWMQPMLSRPLNSTRRAATSRPETRVGESFCLSVTNRSALLPFVRLVADEPNLIAELITICSLPL